MSLIGNNTNNGSFSVPAPYGDPLPFVLNNASVLIAINRSRLTIV
jgi:hypothetical protein